MVFKPQLQTLNSKLKTPLYTLYTFYTVVKSRLQTQNSELSTLNSKLGQLVVSYYNGVFYIANWGEDRYRDFWMWEIKLGEFCREHDNGSHDHHPWPRVELLEDMLASLDAAEKDWLRIYRKVKKEWPNNRRNGYVPRAIVHRYVPKFPRQDKLAGEETVRRFCELVEGKYYSPSYEEEDRFFRKEMTAGDYLELVRIGLEATVDAERCTDRPMTGEDYYKMNGYNRSLGSIFDVPRESPDEFRKWIKEEEPPVSIGIIQ